jgi:fatty acid desaturase
VQAVYPVVRLIFKVGEINGFTLAYGNKDANAPRYDLSLVAVKLLTASRHAARIRAGATVVAAGNPLAAINSGYVFWGALALVVVVLLVVVARLLPKPPAA